MLQASSYNRFMRCKACNYSLWKLTEHRCPECGRAFDPDDPRTFAAPRPFRSRRERRKPAIIYFFVIWLSATIIPLRNFTDRFWERLHFVVIWAAITAVLTLLLMIWYAWLIEPCIFMIRSKRRRLLRRRALRSRS